MNIIRKTIREPLVHFLLIGAAIYLFYGLFAEPTTEEMNNTLKVSAGEIEWMQSSWKKRWNRLPTKQELDGMVQQYIKEIVLSREAQALGLDKGDPIIRRRMAQKMEFLAQDLVAFAPPADEELQIWLLEHQQVYQEPGRYTFSQVFIDPDKRGDASLDDAEKIKLRLMAKTDTAKNAAMMGDALMLPNNYTENTQADIQRQFGSGFAESLVKLSAGQWHGPVLSGYGVHLVYVQSISKPPPPVLSKVRERVLQDWETDKREALNKQFYISLRNRYNIVIAEPAKNNKLAALQEKTP